MRTRAFELALLLALAVTACRTTAPPGVEKVPDPLSPPPPGAELADGEASLLHRALAAAERGDFAASDRYLVRVSGSHPAARLAALEIDFLRGSDVASASLELATTSGSYVAAWRFAAQSARAESRFGEALEAARKAAELSGSPLDGRAVAGIEADVVSRAVREGEEALAAKEPLPALARTQAAIRLVPGATRLRELAVRLALAGGRTREAAELLPSLPDTPEGTNLKAQVAEALGQWQLAESLFGRLPSGYPGRCDGILQARARARLENAPPYLREALDAPVLRRKDLAAILVWELPDLSGKQSRPVPVFEDVVQLAERSDIVVAVRCDLMRGDAVTRQFAPNRVIGPDGLRAVLERLARLYAKSPPRWCGAGRAPDCIDLPETVTGPVAAALVRRVAGVEEACR